MFCPVYRTLGKRHKFFCSFHTTLPTVLSNVSAGQADGGFAYTTSPFFMSVLMKAMFTTDVSEHRVLSIIFGRWPVQAAYALLRRENGISEDVLLHHACHVAQVETKEEGASSTTHCILKWSRLSTWYRGEHALAFSLGPSCFCSARVQESLLQVKAQFRSEMDVPITETPSEHDSCLVRTLVSVHGASSIKHA